MKYLFIDRLKTILKKLLIVQNYQILLVAIQYK